MMRCPDIYIAGMFDAQARLRIERDRIHALGVGNVISLWLDEEAAAPAIGAVATSTITPEQAKRYAERDMWEITTADLMILDTFDDNLRGGREVEFGIALSEGFKTWVVGPKRNVFHELGRHFGSWADVLEELALLKKIA